MSSALKSYVEKYLLNPGASFNVDDEGNEETKAQVVDSLLDEERVDVRQQPLSKLRARRAALEAEKDPRYKGKKVLRKDLKKDNEVDFDPELAKFCIVEGSEDDDEEGEEEEDGDEEEEEEEEEQNDNENNDKLSRKMKKLGTSEFEEEEDGEDEDDEGSSEENEEVKKLYQDLQRKQEGVTFIDDGDFSKFADDVDEEEDDDDDDDDVDAYDYITRPNRRNLLRCDSDRSFDVEEYEEEEEEPAFDDFGNLVIGSLRHRLALTRLTSESESD